MRTGLLRFDGAVERDPPSMRTSHVNVGFFHGAALPDLARLSQGTGKFMRHVTLKAGTATDAGALSRLIDKAYSDIKARLETASSECLRM